MNYILETLQQALKENEEALKTETSFFKLQQLLEQRSMIKTLIIEELTNELRKVG